MTLHISNARLDEIRADLTKAQQYAAGQTTALGWESMARDLLAEVDAQQLRRLALAQDVMALQADISTEKTAVAALWTKIQQLWRDGEGHNHCWRNVERFFEAVGLKPKRTTLPPEDEFDAGCTAFRKELYACASRWPDFIPLPGVRNIETEIEAVPARREHHVKTWPHHFDAVVRLDKRFDVRKNDRGYRVGDLLVQHEWSANGGYTGRWCSSIITFVIDDTIHNGVSSTHVAMSIHLVATGVDEERHAKKSTPSSDPTPPPAGA